MSVHRNLKRRDLFLVRVWTEEVLGEHEEEKKTAWRGKVQRVVDGESHQFNDWQSLLDLLVAMMENNGDMAGSGDLPKRRGDADEQ